MRKPIFICPFIILFCILSFSVMADYLIVPKCKNNVCVEGDPVTFEITLSTDSFKRQGYTIDKMVYSQISLKDQQYNTLIGRKELSLNFGEYDEGTFELLTVLPKPTKGRILYYVPCFEQEIQYHQFDSYFGRLDGTEKVSNCGVDALEMEVYALSDIECRTSISCEKDEVCITTLSFLSGPITPFKCEKLDCADNEGYENHQCKLLDCNKGFNVFKVFNTKDHKCKPNLFLFIVGGLTIIVGIILLIRLLNKK